MDVPIIFSNNSNEFQALMLELKSQRLIMTAIMEEMKQRSQDILKNFGGKEQTSQEVALSLKDNFLMKSGGSILRTCGELVNFTAHLYRQSLDTFLPIGERE